MRIGYLNPYMNSAENQIYLSMKDACIRIDVELVECKNEIEIYSCNPDFVVSVTSLLPKMTHHPTYLAMHEPKSSIFSWNDKKFNNILTYDGYLTISDSISRFIGDFTFGVGRTEEPCFFYLTPQITDLSANISMFSDSSEFKIAYFGTNWQARMPQLLRELDSMNILRIHGPTAAWENARYASYRGPIPFDGIGPQKVYAQCGAGLVLLDERWLNEDVISNRIFEISSVGAVAICPDMRWIRKWFENSVLYFDASKPPKEIAKQIRSHYDFCRTSPAAAQAMTTKARAIFEEHFAAEVMVKNLVEYHHRKMLQMRSRITSAGPEVWISVIVRCGGRSPEVVKRAVSSIVGQTFGNFHIIFAKFKDIDLSSIVTDEFRLVASYEEFIIEGGSRATMLYESLKRVKSEYFSVLDDDDLLLPDHFETLFAAGRRVSPTFDIAFSGTLDIDTPVDVGAHTPCNRVVSRFGFAGPIRSAWDLYAPIHIGSLVARSDLLTPEIIQVPDMRTAEDSLLISLLSRRTKPVFSYRASFLYTANSVDGSNWKTDSARKADEISLSLRGGLSFSPEWISSVGSINPIIEQLCAGVRPPAGSSEERWTGRLARLIRKPSVLLGPLAPGWRRFKYARRAKLAQADKT